MMGLCHAVLEVRGAEIETLRAALQAIDKRIDKMEKKVDRRPGEHDRVKVLAGHLRPGDHYGGKTVTRLGKSWNEKFLEADDDVPPGVVFAAAETFRWANVQYALPRGQSRFR